MPLILIILGSLLIITAWNNTHGQLAGALYQDVPGFLKWAAAIFAIGALGWIPGMESFSRWLLALVITVIVVVNYKQIVASVQALANPQPQQLQAQAPAATQYAQALGRQAQQQQSLLSQGSAGGSGFASGAGGFGGIGQVASALGDIGGGIGDFLGGLFG